MSLIKNIINYAFSGGWVLPVLIVLIIILITMIFGMFIMVAGPSMSFASEPTLVELLWSIPYGLIISIPIGIIYTCYDDILEWSTKDD